MQQETRSVESRRSMWTAALIGIGVMAAVDEIVFHQLLHWHHFFDLSTPAVGLVSDGFLHAAELLAIVAGFFLFADLRARHVLAPMHAWAGFFLGAGGFQVFDGIIDHKVLQIHQIRYDVELWPYDLAWNLFGLALILVGVWFWRSARTTEAGSAPAGTSP